MKVVAINGSPNEKGNTALALETIADILVAEGIDMEILCLGKANIRPCIGCRRCYELKNNACVFNDDAANGYIAKMKEADGIILASPTYFAGITGNMKSFLDRAFYVHAANGFLFRHKAGAAITVARRAGATGAIDQLNKYLLYGELLMATSNYWDLAYGRAPGEVSRDSEGMQTMRILAKNLAWLMKLQEYGRDAVPAPAPEPKEAFSFIR